MLSPELTQKIAQECSPPSVLQHAGCQPGTPPVTCHLLLAGTSHSPRMLAHFHQLGRALAWQTPHQFPLIHSGISPAEPRASLVPGVTFLLTTPPCCMPPTAVAHQSSFLSGFPVCAPSGVTAWKPSLNSCLCPISPLSFISEDLPWGLHCTLGRLWQGAGCC